MSVVLIKNDDDDDDDDDYMQGEVLLGPQKRSHDG